MSLIVGGEPALDSPGERLQCHFPELVEVFTQRRERRRIELVDSTRALGTVDHESGSLEHLEVLRDRGPRDAESARNARNRKGTGAELGEDAASGGIAERGKLPILVSVHLR